MIADAVVVKKYSNQQCSGCGMPVIGSPLDIGTPVQVDLETRHLSSLRTCGGTLIEVEVVERVDRRGSWLPCELLMSGGSTL